MTLGDHVRALNALRAQLESALVQVDALMASLQEHIPPTEPTVDNEGNCLHPPDARVSASGMGKNRNRFYCTVCGKQGGIE